MSLRGVALVFGVVFGLGCGGSGGNVQGAGSTADSGASDASDSGDGETVESGGPADASPLGMADGPVDASPSADASQPASIIYSGVPWLDTDGHLVNAHGVGFIKVGSVYYMVGEQRSGANDTYSGAPVNAEDTFTGVSMYSTTDFASWTFVGTVVTPVAGTVVAPPYYGERPKILYNSATSKYVIYIKMLSYTGSPLVYTGNYAVLTSDTIAGPYSYVGTLGLAGADDFQVFQDDDGTQYLVRSGGTLYELTMDGLGIARTVATGIQSGEAPSLYKTNGTYFWQSSQGTYWHSNDNSYSTSSSLTGSWLSHGNFCPTGTMTWQSQDTAVVTITGTSGTTHVYVGDRWVDGDLPASTLVMQPLSADGASQVESISTYHPIWSLDVAAGTWSDVAPAGTSINDSASGTGQNQIDYDSSWTSMACSGCNGGDKHTSSTAGGTATIAFTGTQILLYSAYDDASGIMAVSLSDGTGAAVTPEVDVSLRFDARPNGNYMVYASPIEPAGSYVLSVRVTGKSDLYSSGAAGNIDRVLVVP